MKASYSEDGQMQWLMKRFSHSSVDSQSIETKSRLTPDYLRCMNACGILYFLTVTCVIVFTSYGLTLPAVYTDYHWWTPAVIGVIVICQIGGNFFLIWSRRSYCSDATTFLPTGEWHMCTECGRNAPPRSHHCPLCQRCIAERDHHCFFTASCIGRDNRRHFIAFCLDCAVGAGYALYVAHEYMSLHHPEGGITQYAFPVALVRWVLGWQTFGSICMICYIYLCAMTSCGSAAIGLWQAYLIVRGQTSYDFRCKFVSSGGRVTVKSICRNVRSVCGPYWLSIFFIPWPLFPLPDNVGNTKIL